MFEKLEAVEKRYEELTKIISDPEVIANQTEWQKAMKEHASMEEIVLKFREYKKIKQSMEEAEELMQDPDMKELAEEEYYASKEKLPKLEEELKVLLIPKDPDDDKNIICEIRAGAGGEEAALFAGTLFRMYTMYAEKKHWKLEILNDEFKLVHQYNPIEHIESRLKTDESITRKLIRKGKEITVENIQKYIDDIAGVRVICSFTPDIYRIVDMISSQDDIEVLKTKDYMLNPKVNGYRSYHLIVRVPIFLSDRVVPTKVEIQIRTVAMDFWASLEHKIYYKYEGNTPEYIKKELRECADLVTFLDSKMLAINEEVRSIREENKE